ncbi:MAG: hypothetical protein V2B13_14855 [Pseudomonadota bacterium]
MGWGRESKSGKYFSVMETGAMNVPLIELTMVDPSFYVPLSRRTLAP